MVDVVAVTSFCDWALTFIVDADTHGSIVSDEVLLAVVGNDPVDMSIIRVVEIESGSVTNFVDAVEIDDLGAVDMVVEVDGACSLDDDVVVVEYGMVDWVGLVS